MGAETDGGGLRHNSGKAKAGMISGYHDLYLARVTEAGTEKYPAHNWRRGMKWSTVLDCLLRHANRLRAGYFFDEDKKDADGNVIEKGTGCPEAAMIAWNCMALLEYMHTYPEGNDLYAAPGAVPFEEGELHVGTYRLLAGPNPTQNQATPDFAERIGAALDEVLDKDPDCPACAELAERAGIGEGAMPASAHSEDCPLADAPRDYLGQPMSAREFCGGCGHWTCPVCKGPKPGTSR